MEPLRDGHVANDVAKQIAAALREQTRAHGQDPSSVARWRHLSWRQRAARQSARLTWRASKTVVRKSYARRRPLAPIAATLVAYLAGVIFAATPRGANTVPLLAVLVAGAVWWRSRRRDWRQREKQYAWAVYASALAWLQTAAIIGAGPPMPGILLALGLAAAVPWWWHHRIRPQVPEYDDRIEIWYARVAGQSDALPGARLFNIHEVETGWAATISLVAGKQTTRSAITAASRIASAYGVASSSVVIEAPPTGEENRARLLVLEQNPLQQTIPFTGPQIDYETGELTIGVYADGTLARWRLWLPGSGAAHGMIAGTTGSGKSVFVSNLCASIRLSGLGVVWLADPDGGASVPDWQNCGDPSFWFAGTVPEIRRMLRSAARVMDARKRRRSREAWTDDKGRDRVGRGNFDPTRDEPLLYVIIEESPDVLADPEIAALVAEFGRKGRKHGVAVIIITQVPSLAELGGNLTLRSMLSSTNVLMFRTSDNHSKQMGMPGDMPVDPASLPRSWPDGSSTAGLGYYSGAGGTGRISPMRAMYTDDPYHWVTVEAEVAQLEQDAIDAAGEDFTTWRERRADGKDELEDHQLLSPTSSATEPSAAASGAVLERPSRVAQYKTSKEAILAHLRARGRISSGSLAHELGIPLPTMSSTLRRLEEEGLAIQVRRGIWASPDAYPAYPDEDVA